MLHHLLTYFIRSSLTILFDKIHCSSWFLVKLLLQECLCQYCLHEGLNYNSLLKFSLWKFCNEIGSKEDQHHRILPYIIPSLLVHLLGNIACPDQDESNEVLEHVRNSLDRTSSVLLKYETWILHSILAKQFVTISLESLLLIAKPR